MEVALLNLCKVSKCYKKENLLALKEISLKVSKHEILGLLGPNGAGKTTLVKIITGLVAPDGGVIEINGLQLTNQTRLKIMGLMGVVLEGARNLYWSLPVLENYYYFGAIKGRRKKEIQATLAANEEYLQVKCFEKRLVRSLSMGEKQRVAIACSLLSEPNLLILDEPSNGLDIDSRRMLVNLLANLQRNKPLAIIITSHDVDFLHDIVDRFVFISEGKMVREIANENLSTDQIKSLYADSKLMGGGI